MLPDSIAKRDALWGKHKTPPDYGAIGEQFMQAGWLADAAEFLLRAGDKARLRKLVDVAVREGDAWLLGRLAAALPDLVATDDWRVCAGAAEAAGRWSLARKAREKAGDAQKAAENAEKVLKALGYTPSKAPTHESNAAGPAQPA